MKGLVFNLEQLKLILFWASVTEGELGLSDEEKKLIKSIEDTLNHWSM
jgi:hypothetical protein